MTFKEKLVAYKKSAYPLLWIRTHEEARVIDDIYDAIHNLDKVKVYQWDIVTKNITKMEGVKASTVVKKVDLSELITNLVKLGSDEEKAVVILKDFHDPLKTPVIIRAIRNDIDVLKNTASCFIFVSPVIKIPVELEKDIQIIDYALPDEAAILTEIDYVYRNAKENNSKLILPEEIKYSACEAAKGMTSSEVQNALSLAYVVNKAFDDGFVKSLFEEKIQAVKKHGLLTYIEPNVSFADVGGLGCLKKWMKSRAKAFTPEAKKYGLPNPKGALLSGFPGTGKSHLAKAVSAEFNFPLFQLDIGSLFGGVVGSTEANFRSVIDTVDGLGRCILYID